MQLADNALLLRINFKYRLKHALRAVVDILFLSQRAQPEGEGTTTAQLQPEVCML